MLKSLIPLGLLLSNAAFAVKSQCIKGVDWLPFCGRPDAPGTRCLLSPSSTWAADFCSPETDGCAAVGGCFGDVPPGYWYPLIENNQSYKCRCGCVAAAETLFETPLGMASGSDLYAVKDLGSVQVATVDSLAAPWVTSNKNINTLMSAKSAEKSFQIVTRSGRSVIASPGHPVLVSESNGAPTLMKKASDLVVGEMVLNVEGSADEVLSISPIDYKAELMNFNVASSNSEEHIVPMNGILLGDYAWQERLNSRDARVLLRADVARELRAYAKTEKIEEGLTAGYAKKEHIGGRRR